MVETTPAVVVYILVVTWNGHLQTRPSSLSVKFLIVYACYLKKVFIKKVMDAMGRVRCNLHLTLSQ